METPQRLMTRRTTNWSRKLLMRPYLQGIKGVRSAARSRKPNHSRDGDVIKMMLATMEDQRIMMRITAATTN
jgi:hypothetical protein